MSSNPLTNVPKDKLLSMFSKLEGILTAMGPVGCSVLEQADAIQNMADRVYWTTLKLKSLRDAVEDAKRFVEKPVDVETFVNSPKYLNKPGTLYPKVMDELKELCSGKYVEAVLTGGIGTGKTTLALYAQAYELYRLSLMRNPHAEFGLDPSSEIVVIFQSITAALAKSVDYKRFEDMIKNAPYFQRRFMFDMSISSELRFPRRIIVKPVAGGSGAAIGQNVIGGIIDELNFMAIVDNSKNSPDGSTYDQAVENYNSIARRRESRFMRQGRVAGLLCLVSSKRYPGQFTDRKQEEARTNPAIFVYDKRVWEVKPDGSYSGDWFNIFIGDATRKPRILKKDETVPMEDRHMVMAIPKEFTHQFENDILMALRDIAGVSTLAIHPFLVDRDKVVDAFGKVESVFSRPDVDFVTSQLAIYPKRFINPEKPRFAHLDLAVTGDCAGVAIGHVSGFKRVDRGSHEEMMPEITIDGILQVKAPPGGEINFSKIRSVLYTLRKYGLFVKWCTLDTFQSVDTIQILGQNGIMSGVLSVDTSTAPYDVLKQAIYDGRLKCPEHEHCLMELVKLERNQKTNKIDHLPQFSKDCSDALAGVVFGLTMRREIWVTSGIPLTSIPQSLKDIEAKGRNSIAAKEEEKNKPYMQRVKSYADPEEANG